MEEVMDEAVLARLDATELGTGTMTETSDTAEEERTELAITLLVSSEVYSTSGLSLPDTAAEAILEISLDAKELTTDSALEKALDIELAAKVAGIITGVIGDTVIGVVALPEYGIIIEVV